MKGRPSVWWIGGRSIQKVNCVDLDVSSAGLKPGCAGVGLVAGEPEGKLPWPEGYLS